MQTPARRQASGDEQRGSVQAVEIAGDDASAPPIAVPVQRMPLHDGSRAELVDWLVAGLLIAATVIAGVAILVTG